jgi:hypothetical protein
MEAGVGGAGGAPSPLPHPRAAQRLPSSSLGALAPHGFRPNRIWAYLRCFRRRTPGPPSFSSMNSTPAASKARRTAKSFAAVIEVSSSVSSARRTVATLRSDCRARSSALQRRRARAALIWALVSGLTILTRIISYAIFYIILDDAPQKPPRVANAIFDHGGRDEIAVVDKAV